jgi:two-component system response regulator MtrA
LESHLILCLSESVQSRRRFSEILEVEGFQVIFATCHDPIRTILVSLPFALIAIDCSGSPDEAKVACLRVRRMTVLPILLLTGPAGTDVLLSYLKVGANDYIITPCKPEELVARVLALLQRADSRQPLDMSLVLRCCDLVVDVPGRRVLRGGNEVEVSPIGFRLLVYFLQHECEVISKHQLLRDVWGYEYATGDLNMVDSAIQRLRRDLGDNPKSPRYIHTVWGSGYRFDPSGDA